VAATIELARVPVAPECRRRFGAGAPAFAATAGEDYELVAAIPPSALAGVRASRGFRLTVVGGITRGRPAVRLLDAQGHTVRTPRGGFDHFR
jgi:thiamine monophosphate kinase